jgi:hypothetical protein
MGRFDALTQIEEVPEKKPAKKLHTEAIVNELRKSAFFYPKKHPDTGTSKKPVRNGKKHEFTKFMKSPPLSKIRMINLRNTPRCYM